MVEDFCADYPSQHGLSLKMNSSRQYVTLVMQKDFSAQMLLMKKTDLSIALSTGLI